MPASADTGQAVIRRRAEAQKRTYVNDELEREPCNVRMRLLDGVGEKSEIPKFGQHERGLMQGRRRSTCFTDGPRLLSLNGGAHWLKVRLGRGDDDLRT